MCLKPPGEGYCAGLSDFKVSTLGRSERLILSHFCQPSVHFPFINIVERECALCVPVRQIIQLFSLIISLKIRLVSSIEV